MPFSLGVIYAPNSVLKYDSSGHYDLLNCCRRVKGRVHHHTS